MFRNGLRAGLLATTLLTAASAHAHDPAVTTELKQFGGLPHAAATEWPDSAAPLWGNLGSLSFPVTTKNADVQRYFNEGLALAYGFNHAEARRSFRTAQSLDPNCAICFWAEALVLGPNINAPMAASAVQPALEALEQAQALAAGASAREQALIEALSARYSADPAADRATLDQAYAQAMQKVAERFPEDLDIAVLYAEALMDLSPWNYWADGGKTATGRTGEIVSTLERVLAANPEHMGAIHLYIHAVEASNRPERAEPYADRLAKQQLGAGHLVHMPSHIYFRLGRYRDALQMNKAAVAADEAYLARVQAEGIYPGGYYPHNIHFLLVSAQMAGDGPTAIEAAEKLERTVTVESALAMPAFVQPIKAAPIFAHAQFSEPDVVLALPAPSESLPYVKAMWHYARGVALSAKGDMSPAQGEADAIAQLVETADFTPLTSAGVPATEVLNLARHIVLARRAQASGDLQGAIKEFEAAAAIEGKLPYMEPPYWYYPVQQSLGAVLLLAGQTERAEEVFHASLTAAPNNGWACFGLAQVYKRQGDADKAAELEARLDRTWAGKREVLDLSRL
jgi:tetratricopeptide (TPR) repeat protein